MAQDCYIQIQDIDGESEAKGFEKWIKADSATLGVSSRGGHTTELSELVFTHPIDKSSAKLMLACCSDQDIKKVTVCLVEEGKTYMEYVLEPGKRSKGSDAAVCRITSVTPTGSSGEGDRPREQVTVRYGKYTATYKEGNITGSYDSSVT